MMLKVRLTLSLKQNKLLRILYEAKADSYVSINLLIIIKQQLCEVIKMKDKHYAVGIKRFESYTDALDYASTRVTRGQSYRREDYVYVSVAKVKPKSDPVVVEEIK